MSIKSFLRSRPSKPKAAKPKKLKGWSSSERKVFTQANENMKTGILKQPPTLWR